MTAKLTAKLSDGQEVELVPEAYCDKGQMYLLRPLNYKPSPPKEVWINLYPDGRFAATHRSKYSAMTNCENTGAVTLRYILAPESGKEPECMTCGKEMERIGGSNKNYFCRYCVEPKPAREWWQVRYKQRPHVLYCTVDTREEAESIVREDSNGAFKQFEVVHVREVVSDGK